MRRNQEVKDKQPDRKKASQESAVSLKHSEELFPEGRSDQLLSNGSNAANESNKRKTRSWLLDEGAYKCLLILTSFGGVVGA